MQCPFCHADNDRVIDSRTCEDGRATRRRRQCNCCNRRYSTTERIDDLNLRVIKKSGAREPFRREKIRRGLVRACSKRPVSEVEIDHVVSELETQIYDRFDNEVASSQIGELVLEHLARLDEVAYVRFASVYRRFKDLHDFMNQLRPMLQQQASAKNSDTAEGSE